MPQNKKKTENSKKAEKTRAVKKTAAKSMPAVTEAVREKKPADPNSVFNRVFPYVLGVLALFVAVCFFLPDQTGSIGSIIKTLLFGLFSNAAFVIPVVIVVCAVYWKKDTENGERTAKAIFGVLVTLFFAVLLHVIYIQSNQIPAAETPLSPKTLWQMGIGEEGVARVGGGVLGGWIAGLLLRLVGIAGTLIVDIALLLTFTIFLFGLTPRTLGVYIAYFFHTRREQAAQRRAEEEERLKKFRQTHPIQPPKPVEVPPEAAAEPEKKKKKVTDRIDTLEEPVDLPPFDTDVDPFAESEGDREKATVDELPTPDPAAFEDETENKAPARPMNELHRVFGEGYTPAGLTNASPLPKKAETEEAPEAVSPEGTLAEEDTAGEMELGTSAVTPDAVPDAASLELMVERKRLADAERDAREKEEEAKEEKEEKKPAFIREYIFPPINLMTIKPEPKNQDISDELHKNADKLVSTLASFKVGAKVVNVSRGPTVTRYELVPEEGVRVRSIANLVDDIALNLATEGVRIEAPIPGKSAVGIEVPNRVRETVYVRDLIDKPAFRQAESKLFCALGKSVAGDPVYLDIAKMPHLLIAGATGMGKSVCINTLITSLLYKATPEEVKMILIDPKKVEFGMYNGIPHLLVPVVSDPKKAAGSLHWAVTEMDRRFELIEDVGARDLKGYTKLTENDPDRERLPQIVIIIDELADLMMTAPDDVESSICRLAQKARAAGMHIVIGTQRPSVDVVTGLIKANVPSRIACTMASQTDSRTVIDIAGAEKLIGKGDMLYAPVGFTKPMRVQGAFVSDSEVESVVDFLKNSCGISEYDDKVMDQIEKEAEKCGMGKKGAAAPSEDDDDGEADPMLRPALELAVESGKISTSLIQRRLSLGYGRAAKLIDRMESLGYVSAPEGQKPRTVLITREQFMEMVLKKDDFE